MAEILTLSSTLSLKIATDALEITDNRLSKKKNRASCAAGVVGPTSSATRKIPLFDVLWAELSSEFKLLSVTFAEHTSKIAVRPEKLDYPLDLADVEVTAQWVEQLLQKAYGGAQRERRIRVLINPQGGRGNAQELWANECEPIFRAARSKFDIELTTHHEHALKIAEELDINSYDAVACVSGDGVPHEVFNGFGRRKDARRALHKIAVCPLPAGSGNGMCWTVTGVGTGSMASLIYIKGVLTPIDLVSVTQGDKRILSLLSQSFGIVAESDLGTDHLRWMGGARFTWGLLTRIWGKDVYPCDVAYKVVMDDKNAIREYYRRGGHPPQEEDYSEEGLPPLKFGTINDPLPEGWVFKPQPTMGNFFAGNMSRVSAEAAFFPAALPSEGMIDVISIDAKIGRVISLKMMTAAQNGSHYDMDCVKYRKVLGYRLVPHGKTGYISIDGESINYEPFQAESHRGLGRTFTRNGKYTGGEYMKPNAKK
ncbi:sphingosine kinase [Tirmania nivea]|nr:sphingosine kinase [Tirmania nivea]